MEKKIMNTWTPLECSCTDNKVDLKVWGRNYRLENTCFFLL